MQTFPTVLVLFGITGDLASKKIIPALFELFSKNLLPERFQVLAVGRREWDQATLGAYLEGSLAKYDEHISKSTVQTFSNLFSYHYGLFEEPRLYQELAHQVEAIHDDWKVCANTLLYLAVPPSLYELIATNLSAVGFATLCHEEGSWSRLIIEKPFGHDLGSSQALDATLKKTFKEEQIYRIDHYLGKHSLRDFIEVKRTPEMKDVFTPERIEKIHISLLEPIGVEDRGAFYDAIGALRDVGQNHLLEILASILKEIPSHDSADALRHGRLSVLRSLPDLSPQAIAMDTLRGQYDGYRSISGVSPESMTETYFALTFSLISGLWQGVPITLEAGKKREASRKCIAIEFKPETRRAPYVIDLESGSGMSAYATLIFECMCGSLGSFVSAPEVEAAWRFIDPILAAWAGDTVPLEIYAPIL